MARTDCVANGNTLILRWISESRHSRLVRRLRVMLSLEREHDGALRDGSDQRRRHRDVNGRAQP